ncbi:ArsR/SmtB family transcription factor [Granulicella sibirica]|uniref:Transcriptional regulator, ArsR family n=1 Tax=Granulicella sibirica TaxID=2479048 RepID=A0A4V1L6B2_9BACT|nr:metalloregulator ArsR/SmtB family transcription factor [Granulicella sibirica]RXH58654.1 Transcriptional regulator, ArsR family [Granulicella sibirica]
MTISSKRPSGEAAKALTFAALGDETRLLLLARLGRGKRQSIAELTEGTSLTRQAVTKHLRVLERVRMVHATRSGRECLFELDPAPVMELSAYLDAISKQWDGALGRLKAFVEGEGHVRKGE